MQQSLLFLHVIKINNLYGDEVTSSSFLVSRNSALAAPGMPEETRGRNNGNG